MKNLVPSCKLPVKVKSTIWALKSLKEALYFSEFNIFIKKTINLYKTINLT